MRSIIIQFTILLLLVTVNLLFAFVFTLVLPDVSNLFLLLLLSFVLKFYRIIPLRKRFSSTKL